mgnify:CR=1 FL=1
MAKNRVEEHWLSILKQFSEGYWNKELDQAHELFEIQYPEKTDKDYVKKTTFIDNAKRNKLMMLKYLAQSVSGNIHPTGANTQEEKEGAAKLIALAEKRIAKSNE